MAERTWHINGQTGTRSVRLMHGWWFGKVTVLVDDELVFHRRRTIVDWGLKHHFVTDGKECLVKITTTLWSTFQYRLYVNGEEQEHLPNRESDPGKAGTSYPASGPIGLAMGAVINLGIFLSSLGFFRIPEGASVRAMGWSALVALGALASLAVVLPCAIHARRNGFPRRLGNLAIVLAVIPWPSAFLMLQLASWIKGFHISQ